MNNVISIKLPKELVTILLKGGTRERELRDWAEGTKKSKDGC